MLTPLAKMQKRIQDASKKLSQRRKQLLDTFLKGGVPIFMEENSRIIDDYFHESFETSLVGPRLGISKNPYAIIAQGGYGRQEQCIHSDIDLLLLFKKNIPDEAEDLIREIVYPLWDIGLDVGYATRSMRECVDLAADDFEILTPILDARFICGMSLLYSELLELIQSKIIRWRSKKIVTWLIERNRARHFQFGDSAFLLEPNLKEGKGGLRDYHTMLWISRVKFNLKQPRDLEYSGALTHSEYQNLKAALAFIWEVRNRLHHLEARKCDQLRFDNQIRLAQALKYKKAAGQQPVELFLGKLHSHMEYIKQLHRMFLLDQGYTPSSILYRRRRRQTPADGLEICHDVLNFASPEAVMKSPLLLIKIFETSATLRVPLGSEARRLVREFSHMVDDNFRSAPAARESFERILVSPAPVLNVLNDMLSTGFLVSFIPQFDAIVDRIQYDEYHLYPVDKHLLRTVRTIQNFGGPEDTPADSLSVDLYKKLRKRIPLLWAALLHDIGKGTPGGDHSQKGLAIVQAVLEEKGYSAKDIDAVSFLVQEHLLLIKMATRRDLNDEQTAILCARKIKDIQRLKMLYLLTVADCISTGPKAWSDWTLTLLRDLFFKVLNILKHGELANRRAVERVEKKKQQALSMVDEGRARDDLAELLKIMSPRYLLYTPAAAMPAHAQLFQQMADADFAWQISRSNASNTRTVTICAKDRPGLFSKFAGAFTLNGMDILAAEIYTWRNQVALDIFEVTPPPDQCFEAERWARAERDLQAALAGTLDLAAAVREKMETYQKRRTCPSERPHNIVVDNVSSSFFTIIEVFTYDFTGLLFSITNALFKCDLDIWVAKIATQVDQVVDVFYVRDYHGQKVDSPDQVAAIKTAIAEVLPECETQGASVLA